MKNNLPGIDMPLVFFRQSQTTGAAVRQDVKKLGGLRGLFEDEVAFAQMNMSQTAYEVDVFAPVKEGTEGGLFFGVTRMQPGLVGDEYFMTRGHFHAIENRAEYYWCIEGQGVLLLMNRSRHTSAEHMFAGSLHYIPGGMAHRVVNTGDDVLGFGACWPADAGYDYEAIESKGFSKRVKKINGRPVLV